MRKNAFKNHQKKKYRVLNFLVHSSIPKCTTRYLLDHVRCAHEHWITDAGMSVFKGNDSGVNDAHDV